MLDPCFYVGDHQEVPENWANMWSGDLDGTIEAAFSPAGDGDPRAIYVDPRLWEQLKNIQDNIASGNEPREAKDLIAPTGRVGRSIFLDRAGLKLANIDRIFNVTLSTVTYCNQQDPGHFLFVDLAGGPGAFTQYIQYRRPNSLGWGITLKGYNPTEWHLLDTELMKGRFNIINGKNGDGNLITESEQFVSTVRQQTSLSEKSIDLNIVGSTQGVDLVVADGWLEPDESSKGKYASVVAQYGRNIYHYQELLNFDLVASELITAVQLVRIGGNLVCKVTDTNTERMAQLLYLVSQCFTVFTIFKPISSRPANPEKYVIGLTRRGNTEKIDLILKECQRLIIAEYNKPVGPVTSFSLAPSTLISKVDEKFAKWLYDTNNFYLQQQLMYTQRIRDYMMKKPVAVEQLDLERIYVFWRLPGMYGEDYHDNLETIPVTGTRVTRGRPERKRGESRREELPRSYAGELWRSHGRGRGRGK